MNVKRTRVSNMACRAGIMVALLCGGLASVYGQQQTWTPLGFGGYWPELVRLPNQATFGPTPALVEHVNDVGTDGFLNEQFAAATTPYPDLPPMPSNRPADCVDACQRDNDVSAAGPLFKNALYGQDQLRQRVAFALSKMFVVSARDSNIRLSSWMGPYQQILYADAFGNFRQLLKDVTLSPAMGSYLNVLNNKKVNATTGVKPNENYAREVLQLFSIGLVQLNQDGSTTLDSSGAAIPTYDQGYDALQALLQQDPGQPLVAAANRATSLAVANSQLLSTLPALSTAFPATSLGNELRQVAQLIKLNQSAIALPRQLFFCSLGGFDTHNTQATTHANLLTQLADAMAAFYQATLELGVADAVTTFTLSDFARTLGPNGNSGTDHAWGGHHLVMGGAVNGGDFYGAYPVLAPNGPDDTDAGSGARGRWIPTTAVDQYAATLASWYGVTGADLVAVFPNLGRFGTPTLNFV